MGLSGADPAQLRRLASRFELHAAHLQQVAGSLTARIDAANAWKGGDAARFRSTWSSRDLPVLTRSQEALVEAARTLRKNADEQDRASGVLGDDSLGLRVSGSGFVEDRSGTPAPDPVMIDQVNQGIIVDPLAALEVPSDEYDDPGREALEEWTHSHKAQIEKWVVDGKEINLPPSPLGYDFTLAAIRSEGIKLTFALTIPPATAAAGLTLSGLTEGKPKVRASLMSGGNSVELKEDGWTAKAMTSVGKDDVGLNWDKDGPWLVATNDEPFHLSQDRSAELATRLEVRPPAKPPWWDRVTVPAFERAADVAEYSYHHVIVPIANVNVAVTDLEWQIYARTRDDVERALQQQARDGQDSPPGVPFVPFPEVPPVLP